MRGDGGGEGIGPLRPSSSATVGAVDGDEKVLAKITDLRVSFTRGGRPLHALRGVSLDMRPGEILGVVGESGSGKTVLGLSLLGLLPSDPAPSTQGWVDVHGVDMLRAGDADRRSLRKREMGAVFQDPSTSLNPTMRVGRQLEEATGSAEDAAKLLEAVGIPEPKERLRAYPHELSGGQQQRVMIAMAIAGNPSLVVADEPTTALDVTVQSEILKLIRDLRDRLGLAVLLITHDIGVAAEIADRIIVLYGGVILEEGPARDVLRTPAQPYTIGLLGSRLDLKSPTDRPAIALPGEVPDPQAPPPGCPFSPRCALAIEECNAAIPPLFPVAGTKSKAACIRLDVSDRTLLELRPEGLWQKPTSADDRLVRLKGLRKTFVKRRGFRSTFEIKALRGVDLEVRRGESVALVGESGSGKTTLLRIVAGLETTDEGELDVVGRPQMVFQDAVASLTPWMSVDETLRERLAHFHLSQEGLRKRVEGALDQVGLSKGVLGSRPRQLSGGQAQRVAIARAIVDPPDLLLADEPTSSLDISLRAVILNLLNELRRELGFSLLFVTHDLAAARVIADRIVVMHLGGIVESGDAQGVVANPSHPYTRQLIGSLPGESAPTLEGLSG